MTRDGWTGASEAWHAARTRGKDTGLRARRQAPARHVPCRDRAAQPVPRERAAQPVPRERAAQPVPRERAAQPVPRSPCRASLPRSPCRALTAREHPV
jgi:hypothetical protein